MFQTELLQDLKGLAGVPMFVLLTIIFYLQGNTKAAKVIVLGFIVTYAVTTLIRVAFFRERPDHERYKTFIQRIDASSFPSLHAMRAGFLAIAVSKYTPLSWSPNYTLVLFCSIAIAISITRVIQKRHFWSDVIVGLATGILIGIAIVRLM